MNFFDIRTALIIFIIANVTCVIVMLLLWQRDHCHLLMALKIDIDERMLAEEALKVSKEKFSKAFQSSPYAILITRVEDGKIIEVNDAFTSITGVSREEALVTSSIGLNLWVNENDRQNLLAVLRDERAVVGWEILFRRKDGGVITGLVSAQMIQLREGLCILSSINDITACKLAEKEVQKKDLHYQALIDKAPDGIILLNAKGEFKFISPSAKKILGYSVSEEIAGNIVDLTHLNDLDLVMSELNRLLEYPSYVPKLQYRCIDKNGDWKWVEGTFSNLLTDPSVESMVINFRDVTERKLAEKKMLASEARYSMLMDQAADGIFLSDRAGHYIDVNQVACVMLGYTKDDILCMDLKDLVPAEDIATMPLQHEGLRQGKTVIRERRLKHKNGSVMPVEISTKILPDGTMQGIIRDITERKRAEDDIHQLNLMLEQRVDERTRELRDTQAKLVRHEKLAVLGQMAGSVGHELRNPLHIINTTVYFLKLFQPDANEEIKRYLSIIDQEVHTSEKIINDLLDFARVTSVEREAVFVSELIRQTLERFPIPNSVNVTVEIPTDLPQAFVDPRQMIQVLGNLIVNAYQAIQTSGAHNKGSLSLCSSLQNDMINIIVKDTGMGISPENMKNLFEPLFTTKTKGIGLGLAVSQKLVVANSGRIEVQSEAGKGSTFNVYLPTFKESK